MPYYKMTPRTAKIFKKQIKAFRKKFGREPGPHDPVFFDPNADTPQMYSQQTIDDIQRQLSEAAAKVGIAPEIVYAMRKTGLIITENNFHLIRKEDLREWYAAIDEYKQHEKTSLLT